MLFLCGVFSASRVLYIFFDAKDVKMEIQAQVPSINFQAYFTKTWTRHFFYNWHYNANNQIGRFFVEAVKCEKC